MDIKILSHLTILPTVFKQLNLLEASLTNEGFSVLRNVDIIDFEGKNINVDILATKNQHFPISWQKSDDGVISMITDLQRLSRDVEISSTLHKISQSYSLLYATQEALQNFSNAKTIFSSITNKP